MGDDDIEARLAELAATLEEHRCESYARDQELVVKIKALEGRPTYDPGPPTLAVAAALVAVVLGASAMVLVVYSLL